MVQERVNEVVTGEGSKAPRLEVRGTRIAECARNALHAVHADLLECFPRMGRAMLPRNFDHSKTHHVGAVTPETAECGCGARQRKQMPRRLVVGLVNGNGKKIDCSKTPKEKNLASLWFPLHVRLVLLLSL